MAASGAPDRRALPPTPVADLVAAARMAQATIENWPQARVDEAVAAIGWHALALETARRLTASGVAETGIGDAADSLAQFERRVRGTLSDLHGVATCGLIESDDARGIKKYAQPVGVVAAFTPSTAPVAAIVVNALNAVKTRNAIVVCSNPSVQGTARVAVDVIREALAAIEAPRNLARIIDRPDRARAVELAESADLVIATGGADTVQRVSRSGRPAYAGGPGNAVIIVDETADLAAAADAIAAGKTFDNGTSCSSESCVLVAAQVWDAFREALAARGAHLCDRAEGERLRAALWPGSQLSRSAVGKPAAAIARLAGIDLRQHVRMLAAELEFPVATDPLAGEKLTPVLALARYDDFEDAIATARALLSVAGRGHSCGVHTTRPERVVRLAETIEVSRIMVNQSTGLGNTGSFSNGMPFTTTITCGPWGGGITNENVGWRHFLNVVWVSEPIARPEPSFEELVAPYTTGRRTR